MSLEVQDIVVRVRRRGQWRVLLDEVSVTVRPGEVLALVGPNGAGKSTLLSVMSGGKSPDAGKVFLEGRPLGKWLRRDPLAVARRRAVLPQHADMSFSLSALEVVLLGRYPHLHGMMGREGERDIDIAWRAMERVFVEHLAEQPYPTLSGGERQRVRMARALAQLEGEDEGPRYLLLDEPAAGLDLAHARELHALLRERAEVAGDGVVVVEHDLSLAATADRIAILDGGRLVAWGAPEETLSASLLSEIFRLPGGFVTLPAGGMALDLPPLRGPSRPQE